jgi:hypothetical protein
VILPHIPFTRTIYAVEFSPVFMEAFINLEVSSSPIITTITQFCCLKDGCPKIKYASGDDGTKSIFC